MKTIQVKIDARLAGEYLRRYRRAFPEAEGAKASLQRFISAFLEDRLCEEIKFIDSELEKR